MKRYNNKWHAAWVVLMAGIWTGCAVGPEYRRPSPPEVSAYLPVSGDPKETSSTGAGDFQQVLRDGSVDRNWWRSFHSPPLNELVDRGLQNNPGLQEMEARLRQSEEILAARKGTTDYPTITGETGASHQRIQPESFGQSGKAREFSVFHLGVNVTYDFDFTGGNRKALEALAAKSEYERFRLEGARLTLAADIVSTAIFQAGFRGQMETLETILDLQQEQLDLIRERVRLGQISPDAIPALETQLEQTRARVPMLRSRLQQSGHLLTVLVGREPGAETPPIFHLDDFVLPPELPLMVPSELVRSRPDILGAEELLHAANAEYGAAVSKLYPQVNLSANLGSQALTAGALFGTGSAIWSLVGQLTQPLFNPGLAAEKRAALAAFDAAAAHYRFVVLESLRNVADVLRAMENDTQRFRSLSIADTASENSLAFTEKRYALGAASYFDLIEARQQRWQTQLDLMEGRMNRLMNTVAFFQAMGGGII